MTETLFTDWWGSGDPGLVAHRQANWDTRHTDPAYIRIKQMVENPLKGYAFVYLFMWDGGVVKVGQTSDFYTRRQAHMSNPLVRGLKLEFESRWPTADPRGAEQILLDVCVTAGGVRLKGREWFRIDADALTDAIERYVEAHVT
jgi:hypothetical protein